MRRTRIETYSWISLIMLLSAVVLAGGQAEPPVARPWKVTDYLKKHRYLAVELNEDYGIPLAITFAVAGLESDWGRSELARQANNHFGIKVKTDWQGPAYCKETQEYADFEPYRIHECFRKYPLIRRSYQDFGLFLTTRERYQTLSELGPKDYQGWAEALQAGGYATDPDYAQKLRGIIWKYQLAKLDSP